MTFFDGQPGAPQIVALSIGIVVMGLSGCHQGVTPTVPAGASLPWDPGEFVGESALEEVRKLVELGPRDSTTEGVVRAAKHLYQRYTDLGIEAEIQTFSDSLNGRTEEFHNVVARIAGCSDWIIIIGSHYDTKAGIADNFIGANDSGSSTGALLELARTALVASRIQPLEATLEFIAFDGEECKIRYGPQDGFHGSRHYARKLKEKGMVDNIRAMILLDMIGDRDLTITIPRNGDPGLMKLAFRAAREEEARSRFGFYPGMIMDDHMPFWRIGIPAIDIIDYYYGSGPRLNDYWHTSEDTMEKISAESLQDVGRVTIRMVNMLLAEIKDSSLGVRTSTVP